MRVLWVAVLLLLAALPLTASKETGVFLSPEKLQEINQIIKRADSMVARKFYEDSIMEYQKALTINPRDHVVHNKLGIAYHQMQGLSLAKKEYELAKKINPKYHEAWNNLGTVHYSLKNYKKAIKYYKKSIELRPDSATSYHNMGAAYFALKKYEEGFEAYREAFRLDPTILERISNSGTIIRTTEVNQGIQNFYLAKIFITSGQPEKALMYLLKALENGFNDYDKITKDPAFEVLTQDERLTRMMSVKAESF